MLIDFVEKNSGAGEWHLVVFQRLGLKSEYEGTTGFSPKDPNSRPKQTNARTIPKQLHSLEPSLIGL